MKKARITIRAAHNRDTRKGEESVTRELDHCGMILLGLKGMVQELIDKMGGDYFYVTGVEVVDLAPQVPRPKDHLWPVFDGDDDYDPRG